MRGNSWISAISSHFWAKIQVGYSIKIAYLICVRIQTLIQFNYSSPFAPWGVQGGCKLKTCRDPEENRHFSFSLWTGEILLWVIARDAWSLKETIFTPETAQNVTFILAQFSLDFWAKNGEGNYFFAEPRGAAWPPKHSTSKLQKHNIEILFCNPLLFYTRIVTSLRVFPSFICFILWRWTLWQTWEVCSQAIAVYWRGRRVCAPNNDGLTEA